MGIFFLLKLLLFFFFKRQLWVIVVSFNSCVVVFCKLRVMLRSRAYISRYVQTIMKDIYLYRWVGDPPGWLAVSDGTNRTIFWKAVSL